MESIFTTAQQLWETESTEIEGAKGCTPITHNSIVLYFWAKTYKQRETQKTVTANKSRLFRAYFKSMQTASESQFLAMRNAAKAHKSRRGTKVVHLYGKFPQQVKTWK